nr:hypothetical protein Itr_chr14CG18850 [Ipomoea trifida]
MGEECKRILSEIDAIIDDRIYFSGQLIPLVGEIYDLEALHAALQFDLSAARFKNFQLTEEVDKLKADLESKMCSIKEMQTKTVPLEETTRQLCVELGDKFKQAAQRM